MGARSLDSLSDAAPDLDPSRILLHHYDATDRDSADQWVASTVEHFGGVDVLINNAGILDRTGLEDLEEDALDEMWVVNVKGPLRLTQLTLPYLRACGTGRVINMASMSGKRVKSTFSPGYSMTKHAVVALSHATRQLGWDDGVRVTAVCPAAVATDMGGAIGDTDDMIQPEDLATLVATLITLPNTASVAELLVNSKLEAWS